MDGDRKYHMWKGKSDPESLMPHNLTYLLFLAPDIQMSVYNFSVKPDITIKNKQLKGLWMLEEKGENMEYVNVRDQGKERKGKVVQLNYNFKNKK